MREGHSKILAFGCIRWRGWAVYPAGHPTVATTISLEFVTSPRRWFVLQSGPSRRSSLLRHASVSHEPWGARPSRALPVGVLADDFQGAFKGQPLLPIRQDVRQRILGAQ